jgi:hypothetical protein
MVPSLVFALCTFMQPKQKALLVAETFVVLEKYALGLKA